MDNLKDFETLGLFTSTGLPIPAQFTVTSRWGAAPETSSAPVRWLLIDAAVTVPAYGKVAYLLKNNASTAFGETALTVLESTAAYTVRTGVANFMVSKENFNFLDLVQMGGQTVISADHAGGLNLKSLAGDVFSSGTDSEVVSTALERSGPLSTVIRVDGRFSQNYSDEFFVEAEFEPYAAACAGDSDPECPRKHYLKDTIYLADWLYPLEEIEGPRQIEYTLWLQFYRNQSVVRVLVTFANHNTCPVANTGGWACSEDGSLNSVGIENLALRLPTTLTGKVIYTFMGDAGKTTRATLADRASLYQDSSGTERWDVFAHPENYSDLFPDPACLWTDWNNECHDSLYPRLASGATFRGYKVEAQSGGDISTLALGNQAAGIMTVEDQGRLVGIGVRDFWQNYPKKLSTAITEDGEVVLSADLFPEEYRMPHFLRAGEKKTHEVYVYFAASPEGKADARRVLSASLHPLFSHATASHYARTQTLDYMTPFADLDDSQFKRWNAALIDIDIVKESMPDGYTWPEATLFTMREAYDRYGYKEHGDDIPGPQGYENMLGTDFQKYEFGLGKLKRAFSTLGETDFKNAKTYSAVWRKLASEANLLMGDVGYLDTPYSDDPLRKFIGIGHSEHDQPGVPDVVRANAIGSPDLDTVFGVEGLLAEYYVSGDTKFRDDALKMAEAVRYRVEAGAEDWDINSLNDTGYSKNRSVGNAFRVLVSAYRATHDDTYLEALDQMVRVVGDDPEDPDDDYFGKPWLQCPCAGSGDKIKMWGTAMPLVGLGHYLDLMVENGTTSKPEVAMAKESLIKNAEFMAEQVLFEDDYDVTGSGQTVQVSKPYWTMPYYWYLDGNQDESLNYDGLYSPFQLMGVDAMAYAAKYTDSAEARSALMDAAGRFFRGGAGHSFDSTWPVGAFTHLGEMRFFATFGDVYTYYATYGFSQ